MHKTILIIGIISLFILSAVAPLTFGYTSTIATEKEQLPSISNNGGLMDSPWPMFQHDVRHTGRSPYGKPGTWWNLKWKFKMDGSIYSSPIIDKDGTIYIGGWNDFYAINPDGSLKWKYEFKSGAVESAAAIDKNGTIYFGTYYAANGEYLYALNPNGTLKWRYRSSDIKTSPVIGNDGTIYFGESDNWYIKALYPNGTLRWTYKTGGQVRTNPAIGDDGTIYCGSHDGYLYALYSNGTLKWKYNAGCRIGGDPTIGDDGTIYFGGVEEAAIYALYSNGTRKWKISLGTNVVSSPALAEDGTIYIGAYTSWGSNLFSINPNGSINWNYNIEEGAMSGSPAIDKYGIIYVGHWKVFADSDVQLYAINPDGSRRWDFPVGDSIFSDAAIGEDGTIYVGSCDEYLYAIEPIEGNSPPDKPIIDGPSRIKYFEKCTYTVTSTDPEEDNVSYYIDWDDGSSSGWTEFVSSGTSMSRSHSWNPLSAAYDVVIRIKAKDEHGAWSDWTRYRVIIKSRNKIATYNSLFLSLLEQFPILKEVFLRLIR